MENLRKNKKLSYIGELMKNFKTWQNQLFMFFYIDFSKGQWRSVESIKKDQLALYDIFKNALKFILILNNNWLREFLWLHCPLLYGKFIAPH